MWYHVKNVIIFLLLIAACFYGAFLGEKQWATNILVGVTWLVLVGQLATIAQSDQKKIAVARYKTDKHLPLWADEIGYTTVILILAASASYYLMVGWTLIAGIDISLRKEASKSKPIEGPTRSVKVPLNQN